MKKFFLSLLFIYLPLVQVETASAKPYTAIPRLQVPPDLFCFIQTSTGQTINLNHICGVDGRTNRKIQPGLVSTSTAPSRAQIDEELVYIGIDSVTDESVETYLQYDGITVLNGVYRAWFRRVFPDAAKRPNVIASTRTYVTVRPDNDSLITSQSIRYDFQGVQVGAATGYDLLELQDSEKLAIIRYFRQFPTKISLSPNTCNYPWQRDSAGKRCGKRAASEQVGGR